MTRRTERIAEQIRSELARLLREELTDPRVGLVTITRLDVSPDLRNARVYWSPLEPVREGAEVDEAKIAETNDGLSSAAGFLRSRLAAVLPTKRVPALEFCYDPSLALGSETLELIRGLSDGTRE